MLRELRRPRARGSCALRTRSCARLLLLAAVAASPARAEEASEPPPAPRPEPIRLTATTGFDFSTGAYGEPVRTDIWYVPLGLKVERHPWVLRVTVPWLRVRGPKGVVVDQGGVVVAGESGGRRSEQGLGDVIAGVSYRIDPPYPALPFVELTAKVKFPTASRDRGLGTGEFDGTLQLDLSKRFGSFTPFVTVGHRFVGDPPGAHLADTTFASLGLDWRIERRLSAGLIYDWRQTASRRLGDSHELVPYLYWRLGKHVALSPYGVVGFTSASPDAGVGLQLLLRR